MREVPELLLLQVHQAVVESQHQLQTSRATYWSPRQPVWGAQLGSCLPNLQGGLHRPATASIPEEQAELVPIHVHALRLGEPTALRQDHRAPALELPELEGRLPAPLRAIRRHGRSPRQALQ